MKSPMMCALILIRLPMTRVSKQYMKSPMMRELLKIKLPMIELQFTPEAAEVRFPTKFVYRSILILE